MNNTEKLDRILEEVSGLKPLVSDHHKTLYGNGQEGLKDRTTVLEERQRNCVAVKSHARANILLAIQILLCGVAIFSVIINFTKP